MEQELAERMRAWRKTHPKATLYEIEMALGEQLAILRGKMLAETACTEAVSEEKSGVICPMCGAEKAKDGRRKRKMKSVGGQEIELERQYMRCAQCGYGVFPPG